MIKHAQHCLYEKMPQGINVNERKPYMISHKSAFSDNFSFSHMPESCAGFRRSKRQKLLTNVFDTHGFGRRLIANNVDKMMWKDNTIMFILHEVSQASKTSCKAQGCSLNMHKGLSNVVLTASSQHAPSLFPSQKQLERCK